MRKLSNIGDDRQKVFCVHCGGATETQDHAPSKVFLDIPYPLTRPTAPSCADCNNKLSADEEYLACFVECVIHGTTDPDSLSREKVVKALRRNRKLRDGIEQAKGWEESEGRRTVVWTADDAKVARVILKLARCHAAYELNEPQLSDPAHLSVVPLPRMTDSQRDHFESPPHTSIWPEVGSRAMQRLLVADDVYALGWVTVQEGRYRYMAVGAGTVMIRGVLSEYLGYEVIWDH